MIQLLLLKTKQIIRSILQFNFSNLIKFLSFLTVITIFYFGIYFILFRIFGFLVKEEFIGEVIIVRLLSLTFTAFFFFLILSNIITSIPTFFRSPEVEFLFSLPISPYKIFNLRLTENIIYASWASLIVDIPILIAYGKVYNAGPFYYVMSFTCLLMFLIIAASLGIFLIFFFLPGFISFSRLKFTFIIMCISSLIIISYMAMRFNALLKVPQILSMNAVLGYIKSVEVPAFRYLPSEYLSQTIKGLTSENGLWLRPFAYLVFFTAIALILLLLSSIRYRKLFYKIPLITQNNKKFYSHFPNFNSNVFKTSKVLIIKDLLTFKRDPTQWGQSLILLLLILVYVFGIVNSSFSVKLPLFLTFVAFANLAFVSYLMVTISVRFAYPSISLEGNSFWFLRTYSNLKTFVATKFFISFFTIFIIGTVLVIIGNIFLEINTFISIFSVINIFLFSWGITGINIGIGGLFPNFKEKNPSRLAAGSGGIISAVISLFYLITSLMILNQWAYHYFSNTFFYGGDINFKFFVLCQTAVFLETVFFTVVFPLIGIKNLKKINL